MTYLEDAYFLSQIISATAVVASLLYLAMQIRHSNQMARSAVVSELQKKYVDFYNVVLGNNDLAVLLAKITDPKYKADLGPDDQKLETLAILLCSIWFSAQTSFDHGLLDEEGYRIFCEEVNARLAKWPAMKPYFARIFTGHPTASLQPIFQPIFRANQTP